MSATLDTEAPASAMSRIAALLLEEKTEPALPATKKTGKLFGPIAIAYRLGSAESISLANDWPFRVGATIYAVAPARAGALLDVGMVSVNHSTLATT